MCIGIPMQVVESHSGFAICEANGQLTRIDTQLLGDQPEGTWLLTFLDTAREVLTEQRAMQVRSALEALQIALSGGTDFDHLFADLVDREPELPDFLRQQQAPHGD